MDIEQLNIEYGITSQLNLIGVSGGFPMILISNNSATALISVYAAQMLSSSLLKNLKFFYFSAQRYYDDGKAIRGGIPVCWPWFGPDSENFKRPNHGFVRNSL